MEDLDNTINIVISNNIYLGNVENLINIKTVKFMIIRTRVVDVTEAFENTESKLVSKALKSGKKVFGIKLDKFEGLLGFELQPGRRVGTELADLVKRFGIKGILHSDELPNYGISEQEVNKVKSILKCNEGDAFILIISESYEKAKFIFEQIVERLNEMINKIPKDTRQVNKDGTTSFLRPQPGSARMYPETDHPLIYIKREEKDKEWYKEVIYKVSYGDKEFCIKLARLKDKSIHKYEELKKEKDIFILDRLDPEFRRLVLKNRGFNDKQIEDILWSEYIDLFEDLKDIKPSILYYIVFMLPSEVKKEYNIEVSIDKKFVEEVCQLLKENKITRDALKPILYYYIKERGSIRDIVEKYNLYKISGDDLKKKVEELLEKYKDLDERKRINKILNELRVTADPKEILSIIKDIKR